MKLNLCWLALTLTCVSCYVTNNNKNTESTTKALELDKSVESSGVLENSESEIHSKYIYLEDVVAGLVHQNWTDDEVLCLNQTLDLIWSLRNFTLWAVWQWDSVSSQPLGILSGNRYQLGNFDQCMHAPWTDTHPELKTQYCLAEVSLESEDHIKKKRPKENDPYGDAVDFMLQHVPNVRPVNYLTWGACVPTSCQPRSVERLVGAVLARSHLGAAGLRPRIQVNGECQRADRPREYDAPFYSFIALTALLFLICVICTFVNSRNRELHNDSLGYKICKAFCLKENSKDLLKVKKEGIETIYGIKYISICFIAMCHHAAFQNSGPISNGVKLDYTSISAIGMFIMHDDVFVDTFFVISGFLLAKGVLAYKKLPNIFIFLIKRYLRIAVCLAVVIFFMVSIFPHTGSGPLWNRLVDVETGSCRENWWLNMIMLSNYINTNNICVVASWYIPCDFHFYAVAVVTYFIYKRWRKTGIACLCAIAVGSVAIPGVITYVNHLSAVQVFTFDFSSDPRNDEQFHITYIKSHTRAAAYLIGFLAGYFFFSTKNQFTISRTRASVGACASMVIMLLVMISGMSYLWRTYSDVEAAFYAALNRPVWAAGSVLLIYSCSYGKVPLLNGFLSWYPWVPLSRLAYGVYLTHTIFIMRNVGIARNPLHYDYFFVFMTSISVILVSTLAALIIWLLAEAPVNNLFVLCVTPKRSRNQQRSEIPSSNNTTEENKKGNLNGGYLQENLPESLHYSSKM